MYGASARGALAGTVAAVAVAIPELLASSAWLNDEGDRLEHAVRGLGMFVPLGAWLGVAAFTAALVSHRRLAGRSWSLGGRRLPLWPLPLWLVLSPALCALAWTLFTGGAMRRLPYRHALVILVSVFFLSASYASLAVGGRLLGRARSSRLDASFALVVLASLCFGLLYADQHVLPGLYGYLHLLAKLGAWLTAALAVDLLLRRVDPNTRAVIPALVAMTALAYVNLTSVHRNQSVHLALVSRRATSTRLLLRQLSHARTSDSQLADNSLARARQERVRRQLASSEQGTRAPGAHVLLITIDALRADHLGFYGYRERATSPELDQLASESTVFEVAFAQAPHSSYSLASLMSGAYCYQRSQRELSLPTETLASRLTAAGYRTAAFYTRGIFHTDGERLASFRDTAFGFVRPSHGGRTAAQLTEAVLEEVDAIEGAGEPPSLIWAHYFDVHEPYRDRYFGDSDLERYDSEIRRVDAEVGRLVRLVDERFERPVVVVVTADHGEEFRDHGGVFHGSTVYQEQIRIPLVVRVPSARPRRVMAPVESVDIAPTVLRLLEVEPPSTMSGDDLTPLLSGAELDLGPAFASVAYRHTALRWPHKLIVDLRFGTRELYDLSRDPRERDNLASTDPDRVSQLEAEIRVWLDSLSESDDPRMAILLRGRSGDRAAVPELSALLRDREVSPALRAEAARLLGLLLREPTVDLVGGLADAEPAVAREAAISLGQLGHSPALAALRRLREEDPDTARRIVLARGQLGDVEAVEDLIAVVESAAVTRDRCAAINHLVALGDDRSFEPFVRLLEDDRMRHWAVRALGRLGDARAVEPLLSVLDMTAKASVRDGVARALGRLGASGTEATLVRLARNEARPSASESLVRVGAIGRAIGGRDLTPSSRFPGIGRCADRTSERSTNFLGRTTCRTRGERVMLPLRRPRSRAPGMLTIRVRRLDQGRATVATIAVPGERLGEHPIDGEWAELRFPLAAAPRSLEIRVPEEGAQLELDHVLFLPDG